MINYFEKKKMKNNSEIFIVYDRFIVYDKSYYNSYMSAIPKKLLSTFIRDFVLKRPREFSIIELYTVKILSCREYK